MKEMKINSDLHFSCTPMQQKINVRVLHGSFSICNSIHSYCFLSVSYTFSKKGPYKSLHFKSLVKMHLFLNYFSIHTDGILWIV